MMTKLKNQVRALARERRASVSTAERIRYSAAICQHLINSEIWGKAKTVAIYASFRNEVETGELLKQAASNGKRLVLPKVMAKGEPLAFFEVRPSSVGAWPLDKGAFGVDEPNESCEQVPLAQIDLLILPALAVDKSGARLGWGGGFYDRTIERCPKARVLAAVFGCQIIESVPVDDHDQSIDGWVSERGLFLCG